MTWVLIPFCEYNWHAIKWIRFFISIEYRDGAWEHAKCNNIRRSNGNFRCKYKSKSDGLFKQSGGGTGSVSKPKYVTKTIDTDDKLCSKNRYKYDTDKTLTQIRFIGANNQPIGVLNWYAVHGTSMNNSNKLVSSDNTGYASILLEQALDPGSLVGHSKVVASFASTNLGDTSPNTNGPHCQYSGRNCDILTSECPKDEGHCIATGPGVDHFDSCRIIGTKLFNAAMSLIENGAGEEVTGKVKYIHQFVDMPNAKVSYINTTTNERTIVSFFSHCEFDKKTE